MQRVERTIKLGVPNLYCCSFFDDEDFIYARLSLPDTITNRFTQYTSFQEYVFDYIVKANRSLDFTQKNDAIYEKTIYIYQYIDALPTKAQSIHEYIPPDLFQWTSNLIMCIRTHLDINPLNAKYSNLHKHHCELLYGLNVAIEHLKMIIKHHDTLNLPANKMKTEYIAKFMRVLANLCLIIIYMRFTFSEG
jgi:hypothetical protein